MSAQVTMAWGSTVATAELLQARFVDRVGVLGGQTGFIVTSHRMFRSFRASSIQVSAAGPKISTW